MIGPHHHAHRHAQSDPRCAVSDARSTARAQERRVLHELVLLNGHDCATQALDGVHGERSDPQLRLQLAPARARASAQGRVCAWKRGKAAACKRECAGWGRHAVSPRLMHPCMHATGMLMLPEQAEACAAYGPRISKPYAGPLAQIGCAISCLCWQKRKRERRDTSTSASASASASAHIGMQAESRTQTG
jgi:hypothetical protein